MARPAVFALITSVLILALLELGSFIVVSRGNVLGIAIIPNMKRYVDRISPEWRQRYFATTFDDHLGWDRKKSTYFEDTEWSFAIDKLGARANPDYLPTLTPKAASFGDSFTFGNEANDNETWQYFLAPMLGGYVANYGVGAYGTDQALLRFERLLSEGLRPEIVILGIFDDNIKRIVNRFRPFYVPATGYRLGYKPRFHLNGAGELILQEQELKSPAFDTPSLVGSIIASAEGDAWADVQPMAKFPYTAALARALWIRACTESRSAWCSSTQYPDWDQQQFTELMRGIIDRFIQLSLENSIQPIIVFFRKSAHTPYADFAEALRLYYASDGVMVIDAVSNDMLRKNTSAAGGHFNALGNKLVAENIFEGLNNMVAPSLTAPALRSDP